MEPSATAPVIPMLVGTAFVIFMLVTGWVFFAKANQPGWASLIPIYNSLVWVQIGGKPWWWFLILTFVPFVNIIIYFIVCLSIAENFGKSALFGLGLALLPFVFYPILAFGDAQYGG